MTATVSPPHGVGGGGGMPLHPDPGVTSSRYPGLPARLAPRLLAAPTPAARGRSRPGRAASSAGEGAGERWRGAGRAAPTSSWRARLSRKSIPWRRGCARRLGLPPHRPGIASEHRAPCGTRRGSSGGHSFRPPPTLCRQVGRLEDAIRSTPPEAHSQPALSCSAYFPLPPPPAVVVGACPPPYPKKEGGCQQAAGLSSCPCPPCPCSGLRAPTQPRLGRGELCPRQGKAVGVRNQGNQDTGGGVAGMSAPGGQRRGRGGSPGLCVARASVWRPPGRGHTAASRLDLKAGQPGPSHLLLTLWLEAHPNSLIILLCVNLAEGEEDPLTPGFRHPWVSDPPLVLWGEERGHEGHQSYQPPVPDPVLLFSPGGVTFLSHGKSHSCRWMSNLKTG